GDAEPDAADTASPTPSPTATPTPTPMAVRSPQVLDSYRYLAIVEASSAALGASNPLGSGSPDFQLKLEVEGAVVAPDREYTRTTAELGFFSLRSEEVRIGERTWTRDGPGPWQEGVQGDGLGAALPAVTPA